MRKKVGRMIGGELGSPVVDRFKVINQDPGKLAIYIQAIIAYMG